MLAMSIKKDRSESKQRKRTSQKMSTVAVAGLVAAMFVISIGIAIPSTITQQQQSAYAHPDLFDPGGSNIQDIYTTG